MSMQDAIDLASIAAAFALTTCATTRVIGAIYDDFEALEARQHAAGKRQTNTPGSWSEDEPGASARRPGKVAKPLVEATPDQSSRSAFAVELT